MNNTISPVRTGISAIWCHLFSCFQTTDVLVLHLIAAHNVFNGQHLSSTSMRLGDTEE